MAMAKPPGLVWFQPYRQQDDAGGLHGVLRREDDPAVVDAAVKVGVWGAAHGEVPLKQVVLGNRAVSITQQTSDIKRF